MLIQRNRHRVVSSVRAFCVKVAIITELCVNTDEFIYRFLCGMLFPEHYMDMIKRDIIVRVTIPIISFLLS